MYLVTCSGSPGALNNFGCTTGLRQCFCIEMWSFLARAFIQVENVHALKCALDQRYTYIIALSTKNFSGTACFHTVQDIYFLEIRSWSEFFIMGKREDGFVDMRSSICVCGKFRFQRKGRILKSWGSLPQFLPLQYLRLLRIFCCFVS